MHISMVFRDNHDAVSLTLDYKLTPNRTFEGQPIRTATSSTRISVPCSGARPVNSTGTDGSSSTLTKAAPIRVEAAAPIQKFSTFPTVFRQVPTCCYSIHSDKMYERSLAQLYGTCDSDAFFMLVVWNWLASVVAKHRK